MNLEKEKAEMSKGEERLVKERGECCPRRRGEEKRREDSR